MKFYWAVLRQSFREWKKDKAPQLAASTAYYTIFSLAPLLIIILAFAGMFLDANAVQESLFGQMRGLVGEAGAESIRSMVEASQRSPNTPLAAVLGFLILAFGATGLLMALQDALNFMWKVEAKKSTNALAMIGLKRLVSLGMILTIGFLLIISLVVSALVAHTVEFVSGGAEAWLPLVNMAVSFGIITLLFALLFIYLPDVRVRWKDVWPGALLTAFLFTLGKFLLGYYLGQKDFTSAYGVAGSIIILLLWVNYSAQIFFFGAEFTKVYVYARGAPVRPTKYARFIEEELPKKQRNIPIFKVLAIVGKVLLVEGKTAWRVWQVYRKWKK